MNKESILGMDICSHIRLSVIVPVYNAQTTLDSCLHSLSIVNDDDIEFIIVDDGSTDRSPLICDNFAQQDSRFKVFHKFNGGVSSARNCGLENAKGEWITFLDADDTALADILTFKPKALADLICFNWEYTTGEQEDEHLSDSIYVEETKRNFLNHHLVDFIFRCPWAKLFRNNIIRSRHLRFNVNYHVGEDTLFVLSYLEFCNTIETVDKVGYVYLRPIPSKYNLSYNEATSYLTTFMESYEQLNVNCQHLLLLLEYYYFTKMGSSSFCSCVQWEMCPAVRRIHSICWRSYSLKNRIKFLLYRCFSIFCFYDR